MKSETRTVTLDMLKGLGLIALIILGIVFAGFVLACLAFFGVVFGMLKSFK